MHAFIPDPAGGWSSSVDREEAELLAAVFTELAAALEQEAQREVLDMMGVDLDAGAPRYSDPHPLMFESSFGVDQVSSLQPRETPTDAPDSTIGTSTPGPGVNPSENAQTPVQTPQPTAGLSEAELLEQLDFDPLSQRPAPSNPYVAAILRPMSKDPELASELRALTTPDLAGRKAAGMRHVAAALRWCLDQHQPVRVQAQNLSQWVTAINDTRLALGWSLGIEDEARSEEIEQMAQADAASGSYSAYEITLASVYTALSWWLETLLRAVDQRL